MDEAIGNLDSNDYGIFIGVVHPACISLGKDNVVELWRLTTWGLGADGVYCGLKSLFAFCEHLLERFAYPRP